MFVLQFLKIPRYHVLQKYILTIFGTLPTCSYCSYFKLDVLLILFVWIHNWGAKNCQILFREDIGILKFKNLEEKQQIKKMLFVKEVLLWNWQIKREKIFISWVTDYESIILTYFVPSLEDKTKILRFLNYWRTSKNWPFLAPCP